MKSFELPKPQTHTERIEGLRESLRLNRYAQSTISFSENVEQPKSDGDPMRSVGIRFSMGLGSQIISTIETHEKYKAEYNKAQKEEALKVLEAFYQNAKAKILESKE